MRHNNNNNNGRRFRGRPNNGGGSNHTTHNAGSGNHNSGGGNNGGGRGRVNPRMQTFDSNGPEVRIRGNAYQINEKYTTLARDAMSSGDRVLAESYLQHAEHYQRMINEMTEEYNKYNPPQQHQQVPQGTDEQPPEMSVEQPNVAQPGAQQPSIPEGAMEDLDQSFLRPRVKETEAV